MKGKRLRKKHYQDQSWKSDCSVYVGRPSKWGNPFKVGRDGTLEQVVKKYEVWLRRKLVGDPDMLEPLIGKDLVCWCRLDSLCHADVLLKLIDEVYGYGGLDTYLTMGNESKNGKGIQD